MVAMILAIVLLLVSSSSPVSGDNNLCIFALPVGQGDATIIQCPDIRVGVPGKLNIIDIGSSSAQGTDARGFMQIADVEKFILSLGSSGVENVFLTHPDIDHYSFFDAVHRAHIKINGIIGSQDTYQLYHTHDLKSYKNCWKMDEEYRNHYLADFETLQTKKITRYGKVDCSSDSYSREDMTIYICNGQATITVLASELGDCEQKTDNPDSLVLQLRYGATTALFVGDIDGEAIATITKCNIRSDILRLSHHGSTVSYANYNDSQSCASRISLLKQQSLPCNMEAPQLLHCRVVCIGTNASSI